MTAYQRHLQDGAGMLPTELTIGYLTYKSISVILLYISFLYASSYVRMSFIIPTKMFNFNILKLITFYIVVMWASWIAILNNSGIFPSVSSQNVAKVWNIFVK